MGVNGVNFKSNLNPYAPVDTNAQQRFQRTEPYPSDTFEKKDNKNKNKKIIAGVLGAAAAIGIAILGFKKGKGLKENNELKKFVNYEKGRMSKLFNYQEIKPEELAAKMEEIEKLPLKEQKVAYKKLSKTHQNILDLTDIKKVAEQGQVDINTIELRRGMKGVPKDVQEAMNEGNWIKAGELYEEHVQKLPITYKATNAGETVEETIKNVFGSGSKVEPHTYNVANEVEEIRYAGYSSGAGIDMYATTTKDGVFYRDPDIITKIGECTKFKKYEQKSLEEFMICNGVREDGRISTVLSIPNVYADGTKPLVFSLLSKPNEMSAAQKDLLSLAEHPERFNKDILIKLAEGSYKKTPNFDYDLVLSVIQSMAKGIV